MIYIDPPYGIKFGSNWQVSARKRDVKDGKLEDAAREVEQIKAFRDTWELGINSYLAYLRDRLDRRAGPADGVRLAASSRSATRTSTSCAVAHGRGLRERELRRSDRLQDHELAAQPATYSVAASATTSLWYASDSRRDQVPAALPDEGSSEVPERLSYTTGRRETAHDDG